MILKMAIQDFVVRVTLHLGLEEYLMKKNISHLRPFLDQQIRRSEMESNLY